MIANTINAKPKPKRLIVNGNDNIPAPMTVFMIVVTDNRKSIFLIIINVLAFLPPPISLTSRLRSAASSPLSCWGSTSSSELLSLRNDC